MSGRTRVMVATNAFGMGVDRSDLRFVVHYEIPGSIEALYQEAGRAGRDGAQAECTLLFTYADTRIHNFFIDNREFPEGTPEDVRARLRAIDGAKLKEIVRYGYGTGCRHQHVLNYFGEPFRGVPCGQCDVCIGATAFGSPPPATRRRARPKAAAPPADRPLDDTEWTVVQKVLSAVARARGEVTTAVLAAVLTGRGGPEASTGGLTGSKSDGILAGWRPETVAGVIDALAAAGCLSGPGGRRELTPLGLDVMWRRREVRLAIAPFGSPPAARTRTRAAPEPSDDLYGALRAERASIAAESGVPPYCVCHDATLRLIAEERPTTREAMLRLKGVGEVSEAKYGERLRAVVARFRDGTPPAA